MPPLTPEQVIHQLRAPLEPSHGIWEIYRRTCDALATLIEQNEAILAELRPQPKDGK
jgi:hypothetical protein